MKKTEPTNFRKCLDAISYHHDTRKVFDAFCRLSACALSLETREAEYMEEVKRWKKDELQHFAEALGALVNEMQTKPFEDVLGGYYMEFAISTSTQQRGGEFHTPKPICELMARMTMQWENLPQDGVITVCEPCCGAGAMILAIGECATPEQRRRLRVTAIDISRTACDMCYINTTLWGIPCQIFHGNTISQEFWASWKNLHWLMPWLPLTMTAPKTDDGMNFDLPPQGDKPEAEVVRQLTNAVQMQLV